MAAWLGVNFAVVGVAYFIGAPGVLGKRPDGSLSVWSWILFLPLHLYISSGWHLLRLLSREAAQHAISDEMVIGRRLLPREVNGEYANYVDLTAEFSELASIRRRAGYLSFPILDGSAPDPNALAEAVSRLRPGRTYIHCAQGHGRSGLFTLAVLLKSGQAPSVEEGLRKIRAARPGVRLSQEQMRCIQSLAVP
jgi:hypothetical protein